MKAREDFAGRKYDVDFVDVKKDPARLPAMLSFSGGKREVPVIVEGKKVSIGFGGS